MIPVTAEDVARRKRRIAIACLAAGAAVVFGAVWIHQRSTAPLKAQAAFEAGRDLMTAARYNQAILNFDGAIALKPDFAEAWLMRGRAHLAIFEPEPAIADFTKAIQLRPRDAHTHLSAAEPISW